ncbi:F-box protein: endocytic membrane traffic, recycling ReCYcling 1 [Malassezia brasiliensis]|uniref:F-box protein: endocytic membrane traffic, recycling ReCYcling 1 n=1 Tax=Malassezia brasiliensis TaxID=1821822 RepID=A0AAF0DZA0_9BASI|nr:F-box protein: endocytic membrane traffic, recycling ReCYcling 1 [Malassezia brasiliensis]
MDRWTPLGPTRAEPDAGDPAPLFQAEEEEEAVGTVPPTVVLRILDHVPLTSLPHVEQASKALQACVRDERLWKQRWERLAWHKIDGMPDALLDSPAPPMPAPRAQPKPPPTQRPSTIVDLLGDLDDTSTQARPYTDRMRRAYYVLRPFFVSIVEVPSTTSSLLFTHPNVQTLDGQCALMHNLARMASRLVHGVPAHMVDDIVRTKLGSAAGYLDMELRTAFLAQVAEQAQGREGAEAEMRRYACLAWDLRELGMLLGIESRGPSALRAAAMHARGGSGVAAAYIAERPLFHEAVPHNPKKCIHFYERSDTAFTDAPVRAFEDHLEARVVDEVARMHRVFPHEQGIELVFFEKLASDLITDYFDGLLQNAEAHSPYVYLEAFARSYAALLPLAEAVAHAAPHVALPDAQAVLGSVWAVHLDAYLAAEATWVQGMLDDLCQKWQRNVRRPLTQLESAVQAHREASMPLATQLAAEKRSFLSKFKSALLTPAVSVPHTASAASLPRNGTNGTPRASVERVSSEHEGYVGLGAVPSADDEEAWDDEASPTKTPAHSRAASSTLTVPPHPASPSMPHSASPSASRSASPVPHVMSSMLSLDTAIELVDIVRLALQRLEVLRPLDPVRIQAAAVRVNVALFSTINHGHFQPGFSKAREEIGTFDFAAHDAELRSTRDASEYVGPLLLFFELVQIGDTIQQMMQVFFDRVAAPMLGKIDFTNAAVREKKKMENDLDEHVAQGMSAGIELLVQHVEHIVLTHQEPRDFYPEAGAAIDVAQPTRACVQCCATLRTYCDLLASCTDKALLDVFYQEIGFRLYAVLCKHLKRQIISLAGGFQVISDLNAYYAFIVTLRQPALTSVFGALKRIGSLYIVEEPKELAKMVRDATLSGGTMRSEDMYEFLRSRSDFKSIERNVDSELYGIKVREDCNVM